eukprot:m.75424 g.75424  ORF g.75424 m.75424 type:complete len:78 (-) comp11843_c0_seq15:1491-1724(-)
MFDISNSLSFGDNCNASPTTNNLTYMHTKENKNVKEKHIAELVELLKNNTVEASPYNILGGTDQLSVTFCKGIGICQ